MLRWAEARPVHSSAKPRRTLARWLRRNCAVLLACGMPNPRSCAAQQPHQSQGLANTVCASFVFIRRNRARMSRARRHTANFAGSRGTNFGLQSLKFLAPRWTALSSANRKTPLIVNLRRLSPKNLSSCWAWKTERFFGKRRLRMTRREVGGVVSDPVARKKKASRQCRDAKKHLLCWNSPQAFCAALRRNVGTSRSSAAVVFSW